MGNQENTKNSVKPSNHSAVFFILLSAFFFALMNLFVRLSGDIPTFEKAFFRNLIAGIIAFCSVLGGQKLILGNKSNIKYIAIRTIAGSIGIFGNYYALNHLVISNAAMLNKIAPFAALICSFFVLKEKITPFQISCVFIAFCGVLLILKPSGDFLSTIPALAGFAGGIGAGVAYTFVRAAKTHGVSSSLIILVFSVFSCIISFILSIPIFVMPSPLQLVFLLLTGAAAAGGQFSITAAYSRAGARDLAVYEYTQVVFSALLGFFILSELPDFLSIIGYVIIIGASLIMYKKNK